MTRFKKYSITLFVSLLLILFAALTYFVYNAAVQTKGVKKLSGLDGTVEIVRNGQGVPTINASTERDLFFAQGFITAQDRLLQMYLYKYIFSGRFSEIIGDKGVNLDRYMRMMNFEGAAKASFANFDPKTQEALRHYSAGVNAFLKQQHRPVLMRVMGMNPDPWRPEDNLLVAKAIAWDMNKLWPKKIKNAKLSVVKGAKAFDHFYPAAGKGLPIVSDSELVRQNLPYSEGMMQWTKEPEITPEVMEAVAEFAEFNYKVMHGLGGDEVVMPGSNAWALSGRKSSTMIPILSSDPHLVFSAPNIFHLVVLHAPGIDITGAAIPGSPGVIIGRNANVSWGFTNSRADQSEIYYTNTVPEYIERKELVSVKGKTEPVEFTFYETKNGVLVSDIEKPGPYVVFTWKGRSLDDHTLEAIYLLNKSDDLKGARKALSKFVTPAINAILADRFGGVAYQLAGSVPKRKFLGRVPVPLTAEFISTEDIPFEELPRTVNPESGYVWSANNTIVSGHYAYNLSSLGFDDHRANRLVELLEKNAEMSVDDNRKIQLDERDNEWFLLKDALMNETLDLSTEAAKSAFSTLEAWDGFSKVDAVGPMIFSAWLIELSHAVYDQQNVDMPVWGKIAFDDEYLLHVLLSNDEAKSLGFESVKDLKSQAFEKAVEMLAIKLGKDQTAWQWGKLHKARFDNKIASKVPGMKGVFNRSVSIGGSRDSLNCMRWNALFEPFQFVQGPSVRVIADMSVEGIHFSMPMGESENPFTSRYDNLLDKWVIGEMMRLKNQDKLVDDSVLQLMPI